MGAFTVHSFNGKLVKTGGNVVSYFLTSSGHVLHLTLGPVDPEELLQDAMWATSVYKRAKTLPQTQRSKYFQQAHLFASTKEQDTPGKMPLPGANPMISEAEYWKHVHDDVTKQIRSSNARKVHHFLAQLEPQPLSRLYTHVFERLLGQKISPIPQQLHRVQQTLVAAANQNRPALFVLNSPNAPSRTRTPIFALQARLIDEFQVLHVEASEMPALSQITKLPPFKGGSSNPMLVMRMHEGKLECIRIINGPRTAETPRTAHSLMPGVSTNIALAQVLAEFYKQSPPKTVDLLRIHSVLKKVDKASAKELEEVGTASRERQANERRSRQHNQKQATPTAGQTATVN